MLNESLHYNCSLPYSQQPFLELILSQMATVRTAPRYTLKFSLFQISGQICYLSMHVAIFWRFVLFGLLVFGEKQKLCEAIQPLGSKYTPSISVQPVM
jgi:hypothetical protein